jgi:DnaJ-class molecular chaperone
MKTFRFWLETVGVINSTAEALQFLELSPGATKEEVQAAIRRLARKYHPDPLPM